MAGEELLSAFISLQLRGLKRTLKQLKDVEGAAKRAAGAATRALASDFKKLGASARTLKGLVSSALASIDTKRLPQLSAEARRLKEEFKFANIKLINAKSLRDIKAANEAMQQMLALGRRAQEIGGRQGPFVGGRGFVSADIKKSVDALKRLGTQSKQASTFIRDLKGEARSTFAQLSNAFSGVKGLPQFRSRVESARQEIRLLRADWQTAISSGNVVGAGLALNRIIRQMQQIRALSQSGGFAPVSGVTRSAQQLAQEQQRLRQALTPAQNKVLTQALKTGAAWKLAAAEAVRFRGVISSIPGLGGRLISGLLTPLKFIREGLTNSAEEAKRVERAFKKIAGTSVVTKIVGSVRGIVSALRRLTPVLIAAAAGWRIFNTAVSASVSAAKLAIGAIGKLASTVSSIAFRTAAGAINVLKSAIRGLLAPTLGVVNALNFLRKSILPFVGFGVLTVGVRNAVSEFSDLEKNTRRATSLLGKFGQQGEFVFGRFKRASREVAAATVFTVGQVSETLLALVKGGINNVQQAIDSLQPTVNLAITGDLDPQEAARAVAVISKQFNIRPDGIDDIADALAQAEALTTLSVSDLIKSFEEAGGQAARAGISFNELTTGIIQITQNLPAASKAGTALARSMARIAAPTKKGKEALEEILAVYSQRTGQNLAFEDFFDVNTGKFKDFLGLFDTLGKAGATFKDFVDIFDFRAKAIINLSPDERSALETIVEKFGGTALSDLQTVLRSLTKAQKENLAQQVQFAISTKTVFGTLKLLASAVSELSTSFLELIRPTFIKDLLRIRETVLKVSRTFTIWQREVREFGSAIRAQLRQAAEQVLPLINQFAKLSLIFNEIFVLGGIRLVGVIAQRLTRAAARLGEQFSGMRDIVEALTGEWGQVLFITKEIANNFDSIFAGFEKDAGKILDAIRTIFSNLFRGEELDAGVTVFISRVISLVGRAATTVAVFFSRVLYQSIVTAIEAAFIASKAIIAKALGQDITTEAEKDLAEATAKFERLDAQRSENLKRIGRADGDRQGLVGNLIDVAQAFGQGFGGFDRSVKKVTSEEIAKARREMLQAQRQVNALGRGSDAGLESRLTQMMQQTNLAWRAAAREIEGIATEGRSLIGDLVKDSLGLKEVNATIRNASVDFAATRSDKLIAQGFNSLLAVAGKAFNRLSTLVTLNREAIQTQSRAAEAAEAGSSRDIIDVLEFQRRIQLAGENVQQENREVRKVELLGSIRDAVNINNRYLKRLIDYAVENPADTAAKGAAIVDLFAL